MSKQDLGIAMEYSRQQSLEGIINTLTKQSITFLKIGGRDYDLLYPYNFKEEGSLLGHISYENGTIKISTNYNNKQRTLDSINISILHEILHGIDNYLQETLFNKDEYEQKISLLAEVLYGVLKDNNLWPIDVITKPVD